MSADIWQVLRTRIARPIGLLVLTPLALALSASPALATETAPPTLIAPGASSQSAAALHVHYSLPEAAAAGSLKLTFEGGETIEVILSNSLGTLGEHELTLSVKNLSSSSEVVSETKNSIPDGTYTVKLTYEGLTASSPSSAEATDVAIRTVTQSPSLLAPASGSMAETNQTLTVEYSLPEAAGAGTVELLFIPTGGETSVLTLAATTAGIHTLALEPSDIALGGSLAAGPQALAAGQYTLTVSYQDALLNPAASSSTTFTMTAPPVKTEEPPAKGSSGTTGAATTSTGGASGGTTAAKVAELSVRWKTIRPTRGHSRALTATFPVVAGASSYRLAAKSGRVSRSVRCSVGGSSRHRQVTCVLHLPSKGRWVATATAVGPAGTLADATTDARIRF